jgi:hypothetical protein
VTNRKRDPKGTSTGGQFAASTNAESTLVLEEEAALFDFDGDISVNARVFGRAYVVDAIIGRDESIRDGAVRFATNGAGG